MLLIIRVLLARPREGLRGGSPRSPPVPSNEDARGWTRRLSSKARTSAPAALATPPLTQRQRVIATLAAGGLSNRETAERPGVSGANR
jgi:DNA-binding NarL/FixJ family response regulator